MGEERRRKGRTSRTVYTLLICRRDDQAHPKANHPETQLQGKNPPTACPPAPPPSHFAVEVYGAGSISTRCAHACPNPCRDTDAASPRRHRRACGRGDRPIVSPAAGELFLDGGFEVQTSRYFVHLYILCTTAQYRQIIERDCERFHQHEIMLENLYSDRYSSMIPLPARLWFFLSSILQYTYTRTNASHVNLTFSEVHLSLAAAGPGPPSPPPGAPWNQRCKQDDEYHYRRIEVPALSDWFLRGPEHRYPIQRQGSRTLSGIADSDTGSMWRRPLSYLQRPCQKAKWRPRVPASVILAFPRPLASGAPGRLAAGTAFFRYKGLKRHMFLVLLAFASDRFDIVPRSTSGIDIWGTVQSMFRIPV